MSRSDATASFDNILHFLKTRLPLGWKWHRSPLGPLQTLVILLQVSVFGSRSYRKSMAALFEHVRHDWSWGAVPSAAAFCKARRKHSSESLRELFRDLRQACSHIDSHRQLTCAGIDRILCVDGTKLTLSSKGTNKDDYGCPSGEHLAPQALLTAAWDIGGNAPVDWRVGRFDESELDHLRSMVPDLNEGDLVIADRLYASRDLMRFFIDSRCHFIFRIKTKGPGCAKEFKDFVDSVRKEEVVEIPGEKPGESYAVRLVRSRHEKGEQIILATSLVDSEQHSAEVIADLYHRRWGIETAYREGKDWLALEELPGQNKQQIEQEITAVMMFWLLQAELEGQTRKSYAREIAKQSPVDEAHQPAEEIEELPVRFNRSLAHEFIRGTLRSALKSPAEALEVWREGVRYLWRNRQRRKPGRSYRRTSQRPHNLKKRDREARSIATGGRKAERQPE